MAYTATELATFVVATLSKEYAPELQPPFPPCLPNSVALKQAQQMGPQELADFCTQHQTTDTPLLEYVDQVAEFLF